MKHIIRYLASIATVLAILSVAPACHNVTPDQFYNATVNCAKVNPQTSAALAKQPGQLLPDRRLLRRDQPQQRPSRSSSAQLLHERRRW